MGSIGASLLLLFSLVPIVGTCWGGVNYQKYHNFAHNCKIYKKIKCLSILHISSNIYIQYHFCPFEFTHKYNSYISLTGKQAEITPYGSMSYWSPANSKLAVKNPWRHRRSTSATPGDHAHVPGRPLVARSLINNTNSVQPPVHRTIEYHVIPAGRQGGCTSWAKVVSIQI